MPALGLASKWNLGGALASTALLTPGIAHLRLIVPFFGDHRETDSR
jgi:hypothetical protein